MGFDWGDIGQGILDVGTLGLDRVAGGVLSSAQNHYQQAVPGGTAYTDAMAQAGQQAQQGYGQQQDFIRLLQQQALGNGPSVAQQQLQMGLDVNNAQSQSLIASQRGLNPALASRMVLDQQAQARQQAAGQGSLLRAQEMLNTQGLLGSTINQARGQSLGAFGQAGGMENQAVLGAGQINSGVAAGNAATNGAIIGGALSGAGALMGMPGAGGIVASGIAPHPAANTNINLAGGGPVPGRGVVPGDSPSNDVVPARLSPGEVVLPRSVMQSHDPAAAAADFVRMLRSGGAQGHAGGFDMGGIASLDYPQGNVSPMLQASDPQPMGGYDDDPFARRAAASLGAFDAANPPEARFLRGGVAAGWGDTPPPSAPASEAQPPGSMGAMIDRSSTTPPTAEPMPPYDLTHVRTAGGASPFGAPTAGGDPNLASLTKAQRDEQAATQALGKAKQDQMTHEAEIASAQAATLKEMSDRSQATLRQRQEGADRLFSDYMSGKVDPHRYWASQGTAGRMTAGIGLILGGIGAGLTHGPNLAMQVIDRAIDRDVEAQKLELGKKGNALSHYLAETGDIRMAQQLAKADARDVAAAQMSAAALKYGGATVKAQTDQVVAGLRKASFGERNQVQSSSLALQQQQLQVQAQKVQQQFVMGMMQGGGSVDPKVVPFLPRELSERVAPKPGGGYGLANTPEDAKEVKKTMDSAEVLKDKLQRYSALLSSHPHGVSEALSNEDYNKAQALHESILTDINGLAGLFRLNKEEVAIFRVRLPDITSKQIWQGHQAKIGELARDIDGKLKSTMRSYFPGAR